LLFNKNRENRQRVGNEFDEANKNRGPHALADWLTFPVLTDAWAESPEKTIAHMAERAADYRKRSDSGSPAERVRARLIATTYLRVNSVLKELHTMQQAGAQGRK
jgi:hypothetical protein